jgi:hypothetical protein
MVADITRHFSGVDVLSHFGPLVDCKQNSLLEEAMLLSVPDQAASSLIPTIMTISVGTLVDSLLDEFPDFVCPAGVQREVRHNTRRLTSHPAADAERTDQLAVAWLPMQRKPAG